MSIEIENTKLNEQEIAKIKIMKQILFSLLLLFVSSILSGQDFKKESSIPITGTKFQFSKDKNYIASPTDNKIVNLTTDKVHITEYSIVGFSHNKGKYFAYDRENKEFLEVDIFTDEAEVLFKTGLSISHYSNFQISNSLRFFAIEGKTTNSARETGTSMGIFDLSKGRYIESFRLPTDSHPFSFSNDSKQLIFLTETEETGKTSLVLNEYNLSSLQNKTTKLNDLGFNSKPTSSMGIVTPDNKFIFMITAEDGYKKLVKVDLGTKQIETSKLERGVKLYPQKNKYGIDYSDKELILITNEIFTFDLNTLKLKHRQNKYRSEQIIAISEDAKKIAVKIMENREEAEIWMK